MTNLKKNAEELSAQIDQIQDHIVQIRNLFNQLEHEIAALGQLSFHTGQAHGMKFPPAEAAVSVDMTEDQ